MRRSFVRACGLVGGLVLIWGHTASAQEAQVPPTDAEGVEPASAESTCRSFTLSAYAYVASHYPSNRRGEIVLRVDVCTVQDQYGFDTIESYSCGVIAQSYRAAIYKRGGIYSTITEDWDDVYQRGARCSANEYRLWASAGQDFLQRRPNRPPRFACPSVYLYYYAWDTSASGNDVHDDFETRGNYNGDYSWRCPVWQ